MGASEPAAPATDPTEVAPAARAATDRANAASAAANTVWRRVDALPPRDSIAVRSAQEALRHAVIACDDFTSDAGACTLIAEIEFIEGTNPARAAEATRDACTAAACASAARDAAALLESAILTERRDADEIAQEPDA